MNAHYPLNLFPKEFKHNLLNRIENMDTLSNEDFLKTNAQMVLMQLWQHWDESFWPENIFDKQFISQLSNNKASPAFYKALLKTADPFFLKAARLEVQEILYRLYQTLESTPPQNNYQHQKAELAIHNIVSIFTMFSPSPFETLTIPQLNQAKEWQPFEFSIEPIELSPPSHIWPLYLKDSDRLFSYGFTAKTNTEVLRILAHCGTGWPTAQGMILQLIADLWPNKTPGEVLFEWNKKNINSWLDSDNSKVTTIGQSLGGSLSYLTAMHRPDRINKAICHVPPGMPYDYDKTHPLFGAWEQTPVQLRPQVLIQKQDFDPVSKCGFFKNDFQLMKVSVLQESTKPIVISLFNAHARNYPACDYVTINYLDMKKENQCLKRQANNYWLYDKRAIVFYFALMPYFFIMHPFKSALDKHAFILSLTAILFISCILFPAIGAMAFTFPLISNLGGALLTFLSASYITSFIVQQLAYVSYDVFFNQLNHAKHYFNTLSSQSFLNGFFQFIYDAMNLATCNTLSMTLHLTKSLINIIYKLFEMPYQNSAVIHSLEQHQLTQSLDAYVEPSIEEKLQTFGLIIIFYSLVFPIKLFCYDIPIAIALYCKQSKVVPETKQQATYQDIEKQVTTNPSTSFPLSVLKTTSPWKLLSFFSCCTNSTDKSIATNSNSSSNCPK